MNIIKNIVNKNQIESIKDYFSLDRKIEKIKKEHQLKTERALKIAILSSFTTKGLKEVLNVECCKLGILPKFYIGDYNQYAQEILKNNSGLYAFKPNLIIVFIDIKSLLGEIFFSPYQLSDKGRKNLIKEKLNELNSLIQKLSQKTSAKIIFHNFEVPTYSPLGILENKQSFGFKEAIEELNSKLRKIFKSNSKIFLFDYNSFSSKVGKDHLVDPKMYYLADIKIDFKYLPDLCHEYLSYIKPMLSLNRKCLVLDLDNTLWGGIIGEDGIGGIKLGPTPGGRPFLEFQKHILSLFNKGIILAINSSNNQEDVLKVFKKHPYMILKEKHFAAMQINWNNKISNMKAIAKQINIGLDSLVFIDDNKANREIIKEALPEVLVIDLPDDTAFYVKTLMEINDFNIFQLTEEDKKRGTMYVAQRKREELQKTVVDISGYLKKLNTTATIKNADDFTIPRVAQLTQKTNQFNMTTRRYREENIKKFLKHSDYLVVSAQVEDKFGDNGITGTVIIEKSPKQWRIDTFLLSCRIIGREIERVLLAYIIEQAKQEKVEKLVGEFISTPKNTPAKDFYKNNYFKFNQKEKSIEYWEMNLKKVEYQYPQSINIKKT